MTSSRRDSQLNLGPLELRGSEPADASFRKSEQPDLPIRNAEHEAANVFDAACESAKLTNKEVAHLCGVSVSLVEKWRSAEARGCPSLVQLLLMPPSFHLALHKQLNARFGFGRQAVIDLIDAVGRVALAVER